MASPPSVISLFSGCGGFDVGFAEAGFQLLQAYDIDPNAVKVYNSNIIPIASAHDLREDVKFLRQPDVLIAGAPCQGFSTAGKRLLKDPRNNLLRRAGELAVQSKAKIVILENVPAALSGKHKAHWDFARTTLTAAGYNSEQVLLRGEECGVPQRRRRLFLVAWQGSPHKKIEIEKIPHPGLKKCLSNVDGQADHEPNDLNPWSRDALIAAHIKPGQKLCNVRISDSSVHTWSIPTVFGRTTRSERLVLEAVVRLRRRERIRDHGDGDPVSRRRINSFVGFCARNEVDSLLTKGYLRQIDRFIELTHTYNGKYRRLAWGDIAPTVDTHFGNPHLFLHPTEERGMTVRESARLQGFSDSFRFGDSISKRMTLIGNAVPPPMAFAIARFVKEVLI